MADTKAPRKIALALQGGGSHGAFTWGVLDRILEDETLEIIGVTGTSAGAMNTVVMADGLVRGGREEARLRLRQFWEAIGKMPGFASLLGLFLGSFKRRCISIRRPLIRRGMRLPGICLRTTSIHQPQSAARPAHQTGRFRPIACARGSRTDGVCDECLHVTAARLRP